MAELRYKLVGDNSQLKKSLSEAHEGAKNLNESFKEIGKTMLGLAGVKLGFDFLKESFSMFSEGESAINNLSRAVSSSGGLSSDLKELQDLAEEMKSKGIFDDDDIRKAMTMQLQLGLTADKVKELIPLAADMAASFISKSGEKLSVEAMTGEINKFLKTGKSKVLSQLGIEGGNTLAERQSILEKGGAQFKGADADAALNTTEGKLANLKNNFDDVKKSIGEGLAEVFNIILPYLKLFINGFKDSINWIKENKKLIEELAIAISVGLVGAFLILRTQAMITFAQMAIETIVVTGEIFLSTLATDGLAAAFTAVGISATTAWAAATLGLSLVIAGLIVAYNKSDTFRAVMDGVGATLLGVGKAAGYAFEAIAVGITGNFSLAKTLMGSAKKEMEDVFSGKTFNSAYDKSLAASKLASKTLKDHEDAHSIGKKITPNLPGETPSKTETTRESITLNIGKLVETLEVNTTNMTEGANDVKKLVAQALQEAIYSVRYTN